MPVRRLALCLVAGVLASLTTLPACGPARPSAPSGEPSAETQDVASRLTGAILVRGRSMDDVRELTSTVGARPTGSAAFTRATAWAERRMRDAGVSNVHRESFTVPASWERGEARGRILAPEDHALHLSAVAWAPPTPLVKGEVVLLADVSPAAIAARAAALAGRVVLLDIGEIFKDGFDRGSVRVGLAYRPLRDAGVVAVLWPSRLPGNTFKAHTHFSPHDPIAPLPLLDLGHDDTKLLRGLLEKGPVHVELTCEGRVGGPVQVDNVIAELAGREDPGSWVLVGAHLDSWDLGPGAQDDGTGVAMVIDAARAIAALGRRPRRSIRFALWAAEEQGLLGATAYAAAHAAELDRAVAVLNTDEGAGEPRGWRVEGRDDVAKALRPLSRSLLAGLGGDGVSLDVTGNSDHAPFWGAGVPALDLWVDDAHYFEVHHQASDTLDKIGAHALACGTAVVAVTAYALAERAERLAPRLDHAGVDALLRKANLHEAWSAAGRWR